MIVSSYGEKLFVGPELRDEVVVNVTNSDLFDQILVTESVALRNEAAIVFEQVGGRRVVVLAVSFINGDRGLCSVAGQSSVNWTERQGAYCSPGLRLFLLLFI